MYKNFVEKNNTSFWSVALYLKMDNLSSKIPQCSELYGDFWGKKGGAGKGYGLLVSLEKYCDSSCGIQRRTERNLSLYFERWGEIQYSSDGN